MSWSISFEAAPKEARSIFAAHLEEAKRKGPSYHAQYEPPEVQDALAAAINAAIGVLPAVGLIEGNTFRFRLSGHANPDHAPRPGWSNDCITVTVEQL